METKTFEIRDKGTFIPVMATRLKPENEADRYLLARAGYGCTPDDQSEYVVLVRIAGQVAAQYSPTAWCSACGLDRTMRAAHEYLVNSASKLRQPGQLSWEDLPNGAVLDVEYILGETAAPKHSEALIA